MKDEHSLSRKWSTQTRLSHTGKAPAYIGGTAVNPSIVRASTVVFENTAHQREMRERRGQERIFSYGARGTPTTFALEDAVSELEGAYRTRLLPTGLAAIGMTLLSYLRPGDHVLLTDSAYQPVRHMAQQFLQPYGIEYTFFAADGSDAEAFIRAFEQILDEALSEPVKMLVRANDLQALAAAAHQSRPSNEDLLPHMTLPCLMFCGDADARHAAVQQCAQLLPQGRFVSLPGVTHFGGLMQSALVLPALREFLDTHTAA